VQNSYFNPLNSCIVEAAVSLSLRWLWSDSLTDGFRQTCPSAPKKHL